MFFIPGVLMRQVPPPALATASPLESAACRPPRWPVGDSSPLSLSTSSSREDPQWPRIHSVPHASGCTQEMVRRQLQVDVNTCPDTRGSIAVSHGRMHTSTSTSTSCGRVGTRPSFAPRTWGTRALLGDPYPHRLEPPRLAQGSGPLVVTDGVEPAQVLDVGLDVNGLALERLGQLAYADADGLSPS